MGFSTSLILERTPLAEPMGKLPLRCSIACVFQLNGEDFHLPDAMDEASFCPLASWMKHQSVPWRWRGFETHRSIALRIHLLIPPAMIIPMEEI